MSSSMDLQWKWIEVMKHNTGKQGTLCAVGLLLMLTFLLSLLAGKYDLSFRELIVGNEMQIRVFLTLRLPRSLMAVFGGFGLGVSGMVYQTVLRNPLASPDMVGVSSGASAGAAVAILFLGSSFWAMTGCAFLGSMMALFVTLLLSFRSKSSNSLVLAGIAVHSVAQTILMTLKLCADPERELASIEYWIMGSLNGITLEKIPLSLLLIMLCVWLLALLYRQILLLSVDEEEASLLGVSVGRMRLLILILSTLIVSAIVSVTGIISFVGLLAPHCARMLTRDNRRGTFWLSGLIGGCLFCIADILARTVAASELPVSIFTSLLGAPFLLFLLMRGGSEHE